MNSTLDTIATYIYDILRTNGATTDLPALQPAFVYRLISNANNEYLRAHRKNGGSEPIAQFKDAGFTLSSETVISSDITTASTSIAVDDLSKFDTSGAFCIWDNNMPDIGFYTGVTAGVGDAGTLTGVTDIGFNHSADCAIHKLYKLPSDFRTFRPSDSYGDGIRFNGIPMRYAEGLPLLGYFSMKENGDDKYLWMPRFASGKISVNYEKEPASLTQPTDTIDVPPEFEMFCVWRVVQILCIPKGDADQLYQIASAEAAKELKDSLMNRNISKYARVKQFNRLRRRPFDFTLYVSQPR